MQSKFVGVLGVLFIAVSSALSGRLFGSDTLSRPSRTYDVQHYRIELRLDAEKKHVSGSTTVTLVPLRSKLDSIILHAVNMDVSALKLRDGKSLRYLNDRSQLTIFFDRTYTVSDTLRVRIDYTCSPTAGMHFLSPDSTDPKRHAQIWTQGEDMDNRNWFPCWDYPNDKATSEVIATVKDSWTLVSNGKLMSVAHDRKNRTKTFHWSEGKPHVSYLVMLVAGEYKVFTEKHRNIPLEYYVYNESADDGRRSLSATPAVMQFLENATGYHYPWEKFAQVFIDDFMWGGMENTSAVTLNTSYIIDRNAALDFAADDVVAHELAHQWFGDLVTARDWTELWLNEGFANYYEALYKGSAKGKDDQQYDLMSQMAAVIATERNQGRKPLVSEGSYTTNLYSKGAMVLYMLNNILGDDDFQRWINLYLKRHAFTSVSTHDLQRSIEDATGENLDWFFEQWVRKAGHPQFDVFTQWDNASRTLSVTVRQTQTLDSLTGLFAVPVEIECTTTQGKTTKTVWLSKQEEVITMQLPEKPLMVLFDKGMKLLKSVKFEKPKEDLLFQLANAEDIANRFAAVRALREFTNDSLVYAALRQSALADPFWAVRREATIYLGTMKQNGVKDAMFRIYTDKVASVRNAAIVALEQFKSDDVTKFLKTALDTDSSYVIQSSCLQALAVIDTNAALAAAQRFVARESYRDILRRSALQVLRSVRSAESLPYALKYAELGNPVGIRVMALDVLGEVGEKDFNARKSLIKYARDAETTIRKRAIRTLGLWGGDDARAALEHCRATESNVEVKEEIDSALRGTSR
ncbi:MAG: HEAT repeat domain-containing protein [Ignavibacteriae bacterium]|nr:HEAT repeat domain-containing protein [Ignavibacteriota bacterium]